MDEQLLNALLDDYGEYYGSKVRLNLGSYAGTSDIDPEFKAIIEDERGIKFVDRDQYDESKVKSQLRILVITWQEWKQ